MNISFKETHSFMELTKETTTHNKTHPGVKKTLEGGELPLMRELGHFLHPLSMSMSTTQINAGSLKSLGSITQGYFTCKFILFTQRKSKILRILVLDTMVQEIKCVFNHRKN